MKGKGSDIKKTFQLPAGKYSVKLDFIKIDSWFELCGILWCLGLCVWHVSACIAWVNVGQSK